jgi:hypothetical protein
MINHNRRQLNRQQTQALGCSRRASESVGGPGAAPVEAHRACHAGKWIRRDPRVEAGMIVPE